MRKKRISKYPVGATWEAVDENGECASIRLKDRDENGYEVWVWSCSMRSFYGWSSDWGRSYKSCRDDITYNYSSFEGIRFKRVKEVTDET